MADNSSYAVETNPSIKVWLKMLGGLLLLAPYCVALEALRPENVATLDDLAYAIRLLGRAITITVIVVYFGRLFTSPEFQQHVKLREEGYARLAARMAERKANSNAPANSEADCAEMH